MTSTAAPEALLAQFALVEMHVCRPSSVVVLLPLLSSLNRNTCCMLKVLDLTEVDPDLRGFAGGFAAGHWGFLVPFKNREADGAFFGKMVRFDLRTFDHASVTVSLNDELVAPFFLRRVTFACNSESSLSRPILFSRRRCTAWL